MSREIVTPAVALPLQPTEEEIRTALASIQASQAFSSSRQLSLFLAYIVEKTLAGEGDRIKAYSIATEALGRPESFDPSVDPIVRVEAGRLRRALETYYQGEGGDARWRLTIPRGSYVPRFEYSELATEAPSPEDQAVEDGGGSASPEAPAPGRAGGASHWRTWAVAGLAALVLLAAAGLFALRQSDGRGTAVVRPHSAASVTSTDLPAVKPLAPRIYVAPFAVANELAIGVSGSQLAAKMATALARFDELTVVTRLDGDADYVVSGTLSATPAEISAAILLTDRQTGRVVWSSKQAVPRNPIQPSLAIDELVGDVAVAIAQPYGVVLSDRLASSDSPDDGYSCLIRSFDYWRDFEAASQTEIRDCLEALTRRYPSYALGYAMLTFTYLDEDGLAFGVSPDSPAVAKAARASAMAVQLAPTSARAQQALQMSYFATGQVERAIETGKRAMTLNPLDTDVRALQGMILIVTGQYQQGARLIEDAAAHNAAYPPWYDLYLALAAFQVRNDAVMRTLIKRVNLPDHPLAALLGLIAGGADGSPQARQAALADIQAHVPELVADPAKVLRRFLPNPALIEQLVAAGRAAGLQD
ncbi:hypothetical protein [Kaistia adipata]|uniref:hypothetical protein n=1 Tax=Kaistia adipata TaxID=166954 RepID=UPI00040711D5|nr:hypothetical protein [Kaistia adipata]